MNHPQQQESFNPHIQESLERFDEEFCSEIEDNDDIRELISPIDIKRFMVKELELLEKKVKEDILNTIDLSDDQLDVLHEKGFTKIIKSTSLTTQKES